MNDKLDLGEIRDDLERQRSGLQERIDAEKASLQEETTNPDRTDLAHAYDLRQRRSAMLDSLEEKLSQVEQALQRLDNGTYGQCTNCGQDIAPGRLRAMPQATLCIRCQEQLER
ncbi:MAG TPA: TraR/DksA C4-type zinc finger protein [Anaerolineales bacterium]|nr:TraR/DksA C4-type zinc finger protein [Anaerolineales bacterium]